MVKFESHHRPESPMGTRKGSVVIGELETRANDSEGSICVAYVYIRYTEAADLTIRRILEILVKQTIERHPACLALAEKLYDRHLREDTQPSEAELLDLLGQFTCMVHMTFYVLDALDEAPVEIQVGLVRHLSSLDVRLFITSRPMTALEASVGDTQFFRIVAEEHDLDLHIAKELENSPSLQSLIQRGGLSLKEEIVSSIKNKCDGMFLHASLQLDVLRRCLSIGDVKQTLRAFPAKIEDAYLRTWDRIIRQPSRHVQLAKTMLLWVLNAAGSMTIEELQHAVATSPETFAFEPDHVVPEESLIPLCCGMVTVDEESRLVRLVHYTARETLESLLVESFPHPHARLASVCLVHLTHRGFQDTTVNSSEELDAELWADPLLDYAHRNWAFHCRQSLSMDVVVERTRQFVKNRRRYPSFVGGHFDCHGSLHLAISAELPLSLALSGEKDSLNAPTHIRKIPPLGVAALMGDKRVVEQLLALPEIQTNVGDNEGWTGLTFACQFGRDDIVQVLLRHPDININAQDIYGWSALIRACYWGNEGCVKSLLTSPGINVNISENDKGRSALQVASGMGREGCVRLLLDHSLNPSNTKGGRLGTTKGSYHNEEGTRTIDHHCTAINLADHEGHTALMSAAINGHAGVVDLLIAHFANINCADREGWTTLMEASFRGNDSIVSLLLAQPGINVNALNHSGFNALILACSKTHRTIVKLLLAHPQIDVNVVSIVSALMVAADMGDEGIVEDFLAFPGIQVNLCNEDGHSAIAFAAGGGYEDITRRLLELPQLDPPQSAFLFACAMGQEGTARILLADPRVEVHPMGPNELSPLMIATAKRLAGLVKLMIESMTPEEIHQPREHGWTPLLIAAQVGHIDTVQVLLTDAPGANVNAANNSGDTAVKLAAERGHGGIIRLLLFIPGINIHFKGQDGHTALSAALAHGHQDIVALLQGFLTRTANSNLKGSQCEVDSVGVGNDADSEIRSVEDE